MVDPEHHDEDAADPLDDALDAALDGGFAAAGDGPEPGSNDSVIGRIGEVTGSKPKVSLRDAEEQGHTPMLKPLGPDDVREAGKYTIQGELGRGGVGAVHRGHDQDLGRDVAMKFLHEKYKDTPEILHRFVEEAQIGGQLQHPGIVPVYDLGMSDGKPFFTMKLVKGKTLAQALADRESVADDRRGFLAIFEQICQTMAYAHVRGVVHRDLKPANIMIGSFGEVQVVDWGMGKVLERGGVADEKRAAEKQSKLSIIETVRSSGHGTQSVMGSVMGTPAYMPPEQAMGDVERMDERSDVFALGAILCEILSGQPPYVGEPDELIGMAAMSKLDSAHERLAGCSADDELVELTKRCLLPTPAARPKSAEIVATAVHEYLAQAEAKIHEAQVTAAEERVRAGAARTRQKLAVGMVVIALLGLAVSLWFWRDADAQRGVAEQAATDARTAEKEARAAEGRERTARDAAETNLANFNRLSHVVRLETAKAMEKSLYPAWPDKTEKMRSWLGKEAKELVDALPKLRDTLAALAKRAKPQSDEDLANARRTHPRGAALTALERGLSSMQKAHAIRSGSAKHEPFTLDESKLPNTHRELNELARPLVEPKRKVFGREAEGLALARRAVSLAPETGDDRAMVTDTLAWALFAIGLDAEAVEQSKAALSAATKSKRGEYEGRLKKLQAAVKAAKGASATTAINYLAEHVSELRDVVFPLAFEDAADQFLHDTLKGLVTDIDSFAKTEVTAVEQRLAWSERVEELTITRHQAKWDEARLAVLAADGVTASKRYATKRFELKPQMGLIPIGMNPQSKLWEFYHLRSAWDPDKQPDPAAIEIPTYGENGKLDMDGRGIVFVLIPGGKFFMGAQNTDESGPNFEAEALPNEGPVREVELAPYFLARHELTQGQWARLTGGDYPSWHKLGYEYDGIPVPIGDSHPVEQVSWTMCDELLTRHGFLLPTEAQWEYGCRGGESTPWFTGNRPGSLEGFANILDKTGQSVPPEWPGGAAFDDRYKGPSPVGTYDPNAFGLHDVHGNVWEWCRDRVGSYSLPTRAGDGLRQPRPSSGQRATRGGSYRSPAPNARAALRVRNSPAIRINYFGVRPAREITR